MENFVNMGRQFLEGQQGQQGQQGSGFDVGNMMNQFMGHGQQQHPQGIPQAQQGNGLDFGSMIQHAMTNDQQGGQNSNMFSQAASFLQNKHQNGEIDGNVNETDLMNSFHKVNQNGGGSSQEVGQAAAVHAFKQFFGNNNAQQQQGGVNALLGKAMAFAGQQSGGDQNAMNHASETVMKMVMKHKMHSMLNGGSAPSFSDMSKVMSLLS